MGHTTLWSGKGQLLVGQGPVRTGVTAIHPRGRDDHRLCFGASFELNAAGEVTGLSWLEERGFLEGPVLITNTHSVGVVRDAAIQWMRRRGWKFEWTVPVVGETYDGLLNDIDGHHVKPEHVFAALDSAHGGPVEEGSVGGGTGMICYEYKGGIGTSSRVVAASDGGYTVGVLVQSNYGRRPSLRIAGLKMGEKFTDDMPRAGNEKVETKDGSLIVVVATDAPLLPHQLKRLAKRPSLGIGRLGGLAMNASGEIFIAFSTANGDAGEGDGKDATPCAIALHPNRSLNALFEATADATEEAILNAMVAAETCEGANGVRVARLPHDRVRAELKVHNLLVE